MGNPAPVPQRRVYIANQAVVGDYEKLTEVYPYGMMIYGDGSGRLSVLESIRITNERVTYQKKANAI